MSEDKSIKETLDVIRRALEDEDTTNNENHVLILNRKVNQDGTIKVIKNTDISTEEINKIIDEKIFRLIEKNLDKWLENKMPEFIEKYLKNK
tara:strand:- start:173 stop:448 length:276 start_codon:yes stop_codon:yes gene_type:complete